MKSKPASLPDVRLFEPERYPDERGYFLQLWNEEDYRRAADVPSFVQDNLSYSCHRVLRGLHYQHPRAQGKLISVLHGAVYDVVVDLRRGSDTFGEWMGYKISEENGRQLYVPEGFAHGFVVLSEEALFHYKCTEYYAPDCEHSLRWDDPDLQIEWPVEDPVLSEKDAEAPYLRELNHEALPVLEASE